jgi:hypothetical protein
MVGTELILTQNYQTTQLNTTQMLLSRVFVNIQICKYSKYMQI